MSPPTGGSGVYFQQGDKWVQIERTTLITDGKMHELGYKFAPSTQTWDTWRYAQTKRFPLTTIFTDAGNVKWAVSIQDKTDAVSLAVPIQRDLNFWGDESDRVGVDANCRFVLLSFTYQEKSTFHSHGIRMKTSGYISEDQETTSDFANWSKVFEFAGEGIDVVGKGVDIAVQIKELRGF